MLEYIVIQAGGRGSRLETLTANKPKALVPVDNLPIIFHLFKQYPDAKFKIVADYKKDVSRRYLKAYSKADYEIVETTKNGTCSGISKCLAGIPPKTPFMLIWCDLVLRDAITIDGDKNYIGISRDFSCRWSYTGNGLNEEASSENGVAGLFIFKDKCEISDVPEDGEFVRYLSKKDINFEQFNVSGCLEKSARCCHIFKTN